MGQAFDRDGNVLGEAYGQTKREVFDKLTESCKDAHEIRIRTLEERVMAERIGPAGLGATGQFPHRKVDEHDEGELRMALAADPVQGIVRMVFGKPVAWLGLPAKEARGLAAMLLEKASELDKQPV